MTIMVAVIGQGGDETVLFGGRTVVVDISFINVPSCVELGITLRKLAAGPLLRMVAIKLAIKEGVYKFKIFVNTDEDKTEVCERLSSMVSTLVDKTVRVVEQGDYETGDTWRHAKRLSAQVRARNPS